MSDRQSENEDSVITQIKIIANEIFELGGDNTKSLDLSFNNAVWKQQAKSNCGLKLHSYTERNHTQNQDECFSEWVDYDRDQNERKTVKNQAPAKPKEKQVKSKNSAQAHNNTKNKAAAMSEAKKQEEQQQKARQLRAQKAKQLAQKMKEGKALGFMKPIKHLKPEIAQDLLAEKKMKQQEEEKHRPKLILKSLDQLYDEKLPLYEKYLLEKQKKMSSLLESRLAQSQKCLSSLKEKPDINGNIQVEGSFEERIKLSNLRKQERKAKILNDLLKDTPFKPRVNDKKRFSMVESRVKKSWSEANISPRLRLYDDDSQTNQFLQNEAIPELIYSRPAPPSASLHIQSAYELTKILQIDDQVQQ